jgi:transcriptional regulator with XRE-family HTH domain
MLGKLSCNVRQQYLTIPVMPDTGQNELWINFGSWLRTQRKLADMSQEQLAAKTGVHEVSIGRYEKGESGAKRDTVRKLAMALGVDVGEAFQRAGFALEPVDMDLSLYGLKVKQKPPETFAEMLEALENLGIDIDFATLKGNFENYTPDDFEELKDMIAASVGVKIKSVTRR